MPYTSQASGYDLAAHRAAVEQHAATVDALADWLHTYDALDEDAELPEDAELDVEALEEEIYEAVTTAMPAGDDPAQESFYDLLEIRKQVRNADSHGLDDTPIPELVADDHTAYDDLEAYEAAVTDLVDTYVEAENRLQDEVVPLMEDVIGPVAIETEGASSTGSDRRQGDVGFTMRTPGGGTTDVSFNVNDGGDRAAGGMESMQDAYDRRDGGETGGERTRSEAPDTAAASDRIEGALRNIDARTAGAAAAGLAALGAGYLLRKRD